MSWWCWLLVGAGAVVALGLGYVVLLAATFAKGDNPGGRWP